MVCWTRIILCAVIGHMPLCIADNGCSDYVDCAGVEHQERAHVQLFYSGSAPEPHVEEPRGDYEWPGMNEDSFYDYFTK